jgi:hypothetical protein
MMIQHVFQWAEGLYHQVATSNQLVLDKVDYLTLLLVGVVILAE